MLSLRRTRKRESASATDAWYLEKSPLEKKAWAISEKGNAKSALALYKRIADQDPEDAEIWCAIGHALAWHGRREEAVAAFMREDALLARKLECCPDDYHAWRCRAVVLFRLRRLEEALATWEQSYERIPNTHYGDWDLKGQILAACGRHEEAIAAYRRQLAIFPGALSVLWRLGNSMYALCRLEEAVAWYAVGGDMHPYFLNGKGAALYGLGRFDEARADFARAVDLGPYGGRIRNRMWRNLGIVLRKLQRHEDAAGALLWAKQWEQEEQKHGFLEDCSEILLLDPVMSLEEGEGMRERSATRRKNARSY